MEKLLREVRHALRHLARSPGFTSAVALTLAVGIGATTTVFSLVDAILLEPLPYRGADRLVAVGHSAPGLGLHETGVSEGTYLHYGRHSRSLEGIATYYENVVNLSGGDEAERVPIAMVSHTFFAVLGARTAVGRLPTAADFERGGEVVVLISYDLWQRRYGGDPAVVGSMIEANRAPRRVIGVLERGFAFPRREIGLWYPSADADPARARATDFYQKGVARLAPGVAVAAAEHELNGLMLSIPDEYADMSADLLAESQLRAVVRPLKDEVVGAAGTALWLLLGGMAFLLLIACANVANLILVRGEHRQKEIAVRAALGAGRADMMRFFATESLVLAALGGVLGVLAADWAVQGLLAYGPRTLPRLDEVSIDGRVLVFTASISIMTALLFAFLPLLRTSRDALTTMLRERGFGITAGAERQRVRRLLVTAQVALALTLVVGSALMAQSFWRLKNADPGFDRAGVLTAEIALPFRGYESYEASQRLWEALLERVRALPGVTIAGAVSGLPLVPKPAYYDMAIDIEGREHEARAGLTVYHVLPGYFETMRIAVLEGQSVAAAEGRIERPVLLSAAGARRLFPGESAVGKRLRRGEGPDAPWATVIGVVADVPKEHIGSAPAEIVYLPVLERAVDPGLQPGQGALVVRTTLAPAALVPAVRQIVRELDPHLPLANVRTMEEIVAGSMSRTSFVMLLLVVTAAAALFLGTLGLYAVISYAVTRRTHEFGIRIALGARATDIRRAVLRDGAYVVLQGVACGLIAALLLTRLLRSLLYEVSASDPVTFAAMSTLLLAVALFASWLPAQRAAAIEPIRALKTE